MSTTCSWPIAGGEHLFFGRHHWPNEIMTYFYCLGIGFSRARSSFPLAVHFICHVKLPDPIALAICSGLTISAGAGIGDAARFSSLIPVSLGATTSFSRRRVRLNRPVPVCEASHQVCRCTHGGGGPNPRNLGQTDTTTSVNNSTKAPSLRR